MTVPTIGFKLPYGLVILRLERRRLVWTNVTANPVGTRDDLRSFPAAAPSHGCSRLSTRSREGVPDLAIGNLRPSSRVMARYRPPIARTRLRIG
jgi:hypothetical protein